MILPVCTPRTEDTCSESNRLSVPLHAECLCPHVQVQREIVTVHSMKACRGKGVIVPLILNVDTMCKRVVSFTVRALYLRHALQERWYGPQGQSGNFGEEMS